MKSFREVIEKLRELLEGDRLTEPQRKHYTYLEQRARAAEKERLAYRRARRHMVKKSRRANRG